MKPKLWNNHHGRFDPNNWRTRQISGRQKGINIFFIFFDKYSYFVFFPQWKTRFACVTRLSPVAGKFFNNYFSNWNYHEVNLRDIWVKVVFFYMILLNFEKSKDKMSIITIVNDFDSFLTTTLELLFAGSHCCLVVWKTLSGCNGYVVDFFTFKPHLIFIYECKKISKCKQTSIFVNKQLFVYLFSLKYSISKLYLCSKDVVTHI